MSALVTLIPTVGSVAQSVQDVYIDDSPRCSRCAIELEQALSIGDSSGPGTIGGIRSVVQDSQGNFYLFHHKAIWSINKYDSLGRYVMTIGRQGEDLGEYQNILELLITDGDTLHVFDSFNRRHSVLSPSLEFIRATEIFGSPRGVVPAQDGSIFLNVNAPTPDLIGLPIHLFDREGNLIRSFGAEDASFRPDLAHGGERAIARAQGGGVWSAYRTSYVIELWSREGKLVRRLIRRPRWFRPWFHDRVLSRQSPPRPLLTAVRQSADGLLWVLVNVPAKSWRKGLVEIADSTDPDNPRRRIITGDFDKAYDTYVEVIDPSDARVVVSSRVPTYVTRFLDDSHVYGHQLETGDRYSLRIWNVKMRQ